MRYTRITLAILLLALVILFLSQTRNTEKMTGLPSVSPESLRPSSRIAKTSCETATSFTQTLAICQKKLNK